MIAGAYVVASGAPIILPDSTPVLVINGVAFWAYLQLSWLVLARVRLVVRRVRPRAGAGDFSEEFSNYQPFACVYVFFKLLARGAAQAGTARGGASRRRGTGDPGAAAEARGPAFHTLDRSWRGRAA